MNKKVQIKKVGLYACASLDGNVYGVPFCALNDKCAVEAFNGEVAKTSLDSWRLVRIADYNPVTGHVHACRFSKTTNLLKGVK